MKVDETLVFDSTSDDNEAEKTIVLESSDDSNVNPRPTLSPLRNKEDFQHGIDHHSTPLNPILPRGGHYGPPTMNPSAAVARSGLC